MTKGKIVLIPFPFDDLSATKVRPAVCLTDPVGPHRHIVLAFITSQTANPALVTDVVLDISHPDFAGTSLRVRSTIRLHRLMTLSTAMISRQRGDLPVDTHQYIVRILRRLFAIP